MKKFLLILFLALASIIGSNAQTKGQQTQTSASQYRTVMYRNWALVGKPSWTSPSFYYCVTRSAYKVNGYWIFDVWFTSNSYTWDYYNNRSQWRYVQMEGCKVYYDNTMCNYGHPTSFSFIKDYNPPALRWATTNPNPTFKIYWSKYYTL